MKPINAKLEKSRLNHGPLKSDVSYGNNGAFLIRCPKSRRGLLIIISDGEGWDHASVSIANKPKHIPTWDEMCFVKGLFWGSDECVIQYHPPGVIYKNFHPGTLHLWKPAGREIPMPPLEFV